METSHVHAQITCCQGTVSAEAGQAVLDCSGWREHHSIAVFVNLLVLNFICANFLAYALFEALCVSKFAQERPCRS